MTDENIECISLYLVQENNFERANSSSKYADIFCSKEGLCVKKLKKDVEGDDKKKSYIKNEKDIYELLSKNLETNKYLKKNVIKYLYGGENFLILKYASKGSLLDYINENDEKNMDEKIAKIIFKKILLCINAIHEIGVCHLDLKPNNILLDKKYEIKICDFGYSVSKNLKELKRDRGYSFFKSPQMLQNISYKGIKSDIFSLGITLYYMISGISLKDEFEEINEKNYNGYLNMILEDAKKKFSNDCYFVLSQMIKEKEEERPSVQEILQYNWFNEIKDLSEEEKNKEVFDYFSKIQLTEETKAGCKESMISYIQYEHIFEFEEPKIMDKELFKLMLNILKIKGKLNKTQFMNLLIHELKNDNRMEKIKEIKPNKEILEFDIIIKDYDYELQENNDLILRITLIKLKDEENDCSYMNSILLSGSIYHYYSYKKIIFELAKIVASRTGSNPFKYE